MVRATAVRAGVHSRSTLSSRSSELVALCIMVLFVAGCGALAWTLNVWQDEAYSLHTTAGSFAAAVHQAIYFEAQAPLYFIVLWFWRIAGQSAFEARCLSIASVGATLVIVRWFAQRYLPGINANIVTAALAINPFTVFAAVETRVYGVVILCSAVMVALLFRGFIDRAPSVVARYAYFVAAVIAIYTQYYLGALLAAGVVVVFFANRKAVVPYLAGCAAVAVALLPLRSILPLQMQAYGAANFGSPEPFYVAATAPLVFLYPHSWIATWHLVPSNAAYALLAVVPFALALGAAGKPRPNAVALLLLVALVSAFFALVIGVEHQSVLIPRHTAALLVPTLLAAFALWEGVAEKRRVLVAAAFLAIYAAFCGLGLLYNYHNLAKNGDWKRVATFLHANAAPGEPVAVFDMEAALPLGYYLGTTNPIVPIPRAMTFERFDESAFALHDGREVAQSLGRALPRGGHAWLVMNDACTRKAKFYGCAYLDAYLAGHARVIAVHTFQDSSVIELRAAGS